MTKSQELKKQILANLTDWCFDPIGDLVDAKALMNRTYQDINSYWFRYLKDDEMNPNWRIELETISAELTPEDYQEVKQAIISEIKTNPQDWKIEKEGELTVAKCKSGRKIWKSEFSEGFRKGFYEREWTEIENSLNSQYWYFQHDNSSKEKGQESNYQNLTKEQLINEIKRLKVKLQKEKSKNNSESFQVNSQKIETQLQKAESVLKSFETPNTSPKPNNFLPIISVVGLVVLVGGLIVYKVKKVKKTKIKR